MKNNFIIAHRGYSKLYGDNNYISFQKAFENNFDCIEMDLQLNKENEIVIFHDLSFNNKKIKEMNNDEIKKNSILFFDDFIKKFDYQKIQIILDLKGCDELSKYLLEYFEKNFINTKKIIIASFNEKHLLQLKNKNLNLGFITSNNFNNELFFQIIKFCKYILIDINVIDKNFVEICKKNEKIIYCYTCHNEYEKKNFDLFDIDGIITNILIN